MQLLMKNNSSKIEKEAYIKISFFFFYGKILQSSYNIKKDKIINMEEIKK